MFRTLLFVSFLLASTLLFPQSAQALFEARVSYGILNSATDLGAACPDCIGTIPSQAPTYGLGADALFDFPWAWAPRLGARYENMGFTAAAGGIDMKNEYTRIALLLNWRWSHSIFYYGPTFSYGLSHNTNFLIEEGSTKRADYSVDSVNSYSASLEAGLKLIGFNVGIELGYLGMTWSNAKDSAGNAPSQDIDMSGPYGKFILGFSI